MNRKERLAADLARYGRIITRRGWEAGEAFVRRAEKRHQDFRRWATALAILLRAEELLSSVPGVNGCTPP